MTPVNSIVRDSEAPSEIPTSPVGRSVKVLLVEDNEGDAVLTRRRLEAVRIAEYELDWARTVEEGLQRTREKSFDACLVDYGLGAGNGLQFISSLRESGIELPCILLTGCGNDDLDIEAMRVGAVDYLNKDELNASVLERSIRYAIERRRSEHALMLAARRDTLTGLHNRASLYERLDTAIERFHRSGRFLSILAIDLNGFKAINDALGHQAGDDLLRVIASRLLETVRPYDVVARIGGDEFIVMVEDLDPSDGTPTSDDRIPAEIMSGLADRIMRSIAAPVTIDAETVSVSASIGIATCPDDSVSRQGLLRSADRAMYRSKRGGGGISLFDSDIDGVSTVIPNREGHKEICGGYIDLAFQPQINLLDGRIRGCEALLRWTTSSGRKMTPAECVPMFRQAGTIHEVGECIRERAASQTEAWQQQGMFVGRLAVNLTAAELCHHGLPGRVEELLERYPVSLEIELTESEIVPDDLRARSAIARLRALGVRIAIDDFGSGYSSLQRVRTMPCDVLKIDRSFISNIAYSSQDRAIVESMVRLADGLGAELIAEGVETENQRITLIDLGVRYGQGFGLCNPLLPHQFEEWRLYGAATSGASIPHVA